MTNRILVGAFALLLVAGCGDEEKNGGGNGGGGGRIKAGDARMPPQLVELYDAADGAGMMELELNRDGSFLEMETEIPVGDLPENLREAADEHLPGGEITGAEIEYILENGKWRKSYEVKKSIDGMDYELVMDENGNVLEKEMEIDRSEAPEAVLEAGEGAVEDSSFVSVERISVGEKTVYHVKVEKDGASYKIVLDPDGKILRKVREQKAEIEIPLE